MRSVRERVGFCGWLLLLLSQLAVAQTVYRDDFNSGAQLPWISVRGNWQTLAGEYLAQAPGNLPPTATLLPAVLGDFSLEIDLLDAVDGGLWLRTNADASAGVLLVVQADRLYWHVIADPMTGPYTIYGQSAISPASKRRLRVTGQGPLLRVYLPGIAAAVSTLDLRTVSNPPGLNYLRGQLGLYDNASPGTRFDNLRLEAGTPVEVLVVGDAGNGAVKLFNADAGGDVAPLAVLAGPNTGLVDIRGVALDSDTLFVSSGTGKYVKAFALGQLGDVAALRTLSGPATGLGNVYQIALAENELFVPSDTGPVSVFGAGDDGDVAPRRRIESTVGGYAVEVAEDELFFARHFLPPTDLTVFARLASGSALPLRQLAGNSTGLSSANLGLAVTANELFVSLYLNARVQVYPRQADGDIAPLRTLSGPLTGLGANVDVAIRGDELFVANSIGNVLVFSAQANGNSAPVRILEGPATGFNAPFALAFGIYMLPDPLFDNGFESP